MRPFILLAVAVAAAALVARPPGAAAQPAGADEARQQYEQGYQALQAGQYQAALDHYQRSYQLVARPRTLFNIAVCEEKLGRLADAVGHYKKFLEVAEARDAKFTQDAREKIAALSRQLPAAAATEPKPPPPPPVEVKPPPPPKPRAVRPHAASERCLADPAGTLRVQSNLSGATVSVDGLVVGATADASGDGAALRYPLTPGDHDVVVERPGAAPWRERVHAAPGETIGVDVAFRPARSTGRKVLTWGLAGLGVVGGATAGTLGVLALRDVASPDLDRHARGKTRAWMTDALLVVSAGALYGAWRLHHHPAPVTATVHADVAAEARR